MENWSVIPSDSDSSAADRQDCTEVSGNRRSQWRIENGQWTMENWSVMPSDPDSSAADRQDCTEVSGNRRSQWTIENGQWTMENWSVMPSDPDSSAADRQDCTEVSGNRRSQWTNASSTKSIGPSRRVPTKEVYRGGRTIDYVNSICNLVIWNS
jgi:hypothetical protein